MTAGVCHRKDLGLERFVVSKYPRIPISENGEVYWSLLNWGDDMPHMDQVEVFQKVFGHFNYELYPVRFLSTSDHTKAYLKSAFVKEDDTVYLPHPWGVIKSPFSFIENPDAIAVCHFNYGGPWAGWCFINEKYYFALHSAVDRVRLYDVLIHEFYHGIVGLLHTAAPKDIMNAVYDPENVVTKDTRDATDVVWGVIRRELMAKIPSAQYLILKKPRTPIYSAKPLV